MNYNELKQLTEQATSLNIHTFAQLKHLKDKYPATRANTTYPSRRSSGLLGFIAACYFHDLKWEDIK